VNRAPLPEPDFTLDGDTTACYYAETVTRLLAAAQQQPEAPELTDDEIMRCIDDEFPVSLVDPIVLQKVYSVCRSVLASQPKPLPPSLTDKEIWKLWLTTEVGPYDFARAVLAAQAAKGKP